jgi:hypothetical protein
MIKTMPHAPARMIAILASFLLLPAARAAVSDSPAARIQSPLPAPTAAVPAPLRAPELRTLLAAPADRTALIFRLYQADRGNMTRTFSLPWSTWGRARLNGFYESWRAALERIDLSKLDPSSRAALEKIRSGIDEDRGRIAEQIRREREIEPLVPFAPLLSGLEESRRKFEAVDPASAASRLARAMRAIDGLSAGLRGGTVKPVQPAAGQAADAITSLRTQLKNWFEFYNGYDPLFSWWMAPTYRDTDQALAAYAAALRSSPAAATEGMPPVGQPSSGGEAAVPTADAPDIAALLNAPLSEMVPILQRYQTDLASFRRPAQRGEGPLSPAPALPAGRKDFLKSWRAALARLDFRPLSLDGQIDFLLLRNSVDIEIRKMESLERRPAAEPLRPADAGGIPGRPIGREALLLELAGEMISYSPEELVAIAGKEYAWCEAEMKKAAAEMGFGEDWKKALEAVKGRYVAPGNQPGLIRALAVEAIEYLRANDLLTLPPVAAETWRMEMMSPERQLVNPYFTGGEVISVSFPTNTMSYEAKLQSLRSNNPHFCRATVHHELIPGHHLAGYMNARFSTQRRPFGTAFWGEGWPLYWEMTLYDKGFVKTPEDRVGFLFWRMHRCARIVFSLSFHLGAMTAPQCVDYLVEKVGHERSAAEAEVRRSFEGGYGPLYQAAYMVGGLQIRSLRREFVDSGRMSERTFHDAILRGGSMPIVMVRALLAGTKLTSARIPDWDFYGLHPAKR